MRFRWIVHYTPRMFRLPRASSSAEWFVQFSMTLLEGSEAKSTRLKERIVEAMDQQAPQPLQTSTVELQTLEARSDEPDVGKGDVGELTAPLSGDADTAAERHQEVAKLLAAGEAFVGVCPDAVHGMDAFRFSQDILELDLNMVIDVVWVTVHEVDFSHG